MPLSLFLSYGRNIFRIRRMSVRAPPRQQPHKKTNFKNSLIKMMMDAVNATQEDRNPQISYGAAAHEKNDIIIVEASKKETNDHVESTSTSSSTIQHEFAVPSACWKTDETIEFDNAVGSVYVTDDALLFQCTSSVDHSVSIDAECILLHAQAEDDKVLYLQLSEPANGGVSADTEVMEMTLTLESATASQQLFEALSQLVSLHPVYDDDDDDDPNDAGGGGMMMMGENGPEENYGDDMVVADAEQETAGADEERNSMLDRLDNMLTVPPHLAQDGDDGDDAGGQFDDAEDDVDQLL